MLKKPSFFATGIFTFLLSIAMYQPAFAAMVSTESLMMNSYSSTNITETRLQFVEQLEQLGITKDQAIERVSQLSDIQIKDISTRFDEMPAGASAGGILLTVFIVFVITDVIGATDIFPFIKAVK